MDPTGSDPWGSEEGRGHPEAEAGGEGPQPTDERPRWYEDPVFLACAIQDLLRALGISEARMRAVPPLFGFDSGLDAHPAPERALFGDLVPLAGEVLEALEREQIGADLFGVDRRAVEAVLPALMEDLRQAEALGLGDEELAGRMKTSLEPLPDLPMVPLREPTREEVGRIVAILQRMPRPTLRHITPVTNRIALHAMVRTALLAARTFTEFLEEGPFTSRGLTLLRRLSFLIPDPGLRQTVSDLETWHDEAPEGFGGAKMVAYEEQPDGSFRRVSPEELAAREEAGPLPLDQQQRAQRGRRVHRSFLLTVLGALLPVLVLTAWVAFGRWPPEFGAVSGLTQATWLSVLVISIAAAIWGTVGLRDGEALRGIDPMRRRVWTRLTALVGVCAGFLLPLLSLCVLFLVDIIPTSWFGAVGMVLMTFAFLPLGMVPGVLRAADRAAELDRMSEEAAASDAAPAQERSRRTTGRADAD